jgi:phage terminase Nu1 subunit (DNA packaging protein)
MKKDSVSFATQKQFADAIGVDVRTVKTWVAAGMPRHPSGGSRHRYVLSEVWQWKMEQVGGDPLMAADADGSVGLERYRLAKAQLAEFDLEEKRKTFLPRETVRDSLVRWAAIIRRLGERLSKRYGVEAARELNDTLDECQKVVDDDFSNTE